MAGLAPIYRSVPIAGPIKWSAFALVVAGSAPAFAQTFLVTEDFNNNTDTYWQGQNNRLSPQNFGWSSTDFTGTALAPTGGTATGAGELGGFMQRASNPPHFYGFNVGTLTMLEPLEAHFVINMQDFVNINIGFLRATGDPPVSESWDPGGGGDPRNFMGFFFDDGFDLYSLVAGPNGERERTNSPSTMNLTLAQTHRLDLSYDPSANEGNGALTLTVNGISEVHNLPGGVAAALNPFTHFGVFTTPAAGGGSGLFYIDDATFSSQNGIPVPPGWGADMNGNWSAPGNWIGPVPNADGAIANFGEVITAARIITLDAPQTVGVVNFDNTNSYTIAGANTLTVSNTIAATASIAVVAGSHSISAPLALNTRTNMDVAASSTLSVSGDVSGSGGVTKSGLGTVVLSGTNTYSGNTEINRGVLSVGSSDNLGAANNSLVFDGGTLLTTGAINSAGRNITINNNAVGGTIDSNGHDSSFGNVTGTGRLTKTGAGKVTVNHLQSRFLTINGGELEVAVSGNTIANTSRVRSLTILPGAILDLTDNKLIVADPFQPNQTGTWTGTAYDGVSGLVDAGRGNAGNALWDGSGVVTSDTRAISNGDLVSIGVAQVADARGIADTETTTFAGQTVLGSDTLVMVTWGGDANLDGKINIDDYGRIDGNVGQSGSVFGWSKGDFNYDGKINIDDYGIIDGNINRQGTPFSTAGAAEGVAAVPEPAALALSLSLAAGAVVRRRRR
jgi:autotransporter-associated beta strand protein